MLRVTLAAALVVASVADARGKSKMIELRSMPSSPRAMAAALAKEKPGPFRDSLAWALETKVRELGTELSDPDAVDALTTQMFQHIFDDMAAPSDIWVWEGSAGPRGDVLVRGAVVLLPGVNTSGYAQSFTVSPKGKRIDRGYLNTPCTVKVVVAKSQPEWHATVDAKGWGAFVHGVRRLDGVVRVAVTLLSPGGAAGSGALAPRHERPVWVAFFTEGEKPGDFDLVDFAPARAKAQADQESNLLPGTGKRLTDAQRRHVLALRMEDVRVISPERTAFISREGDWFSLDGLTTAPVDKRSVSWLDVYRTSDAPLVRAAAVLKASALGGTVQPSELVDVLVSVKVGAVQRQAGAQLEKLLTASSDAVAEPDLGALKKAGGGDEVKVLKDVALVKGGGKSTFFTRGASGWAEVKLKR